MGNPTLSQIISNVHDIHFHSPPKMLDDWCSVFAKVTEGLKTIQVSYLGVQKNRDLSSQVIAGKLGPHKGNIFSISIFLCLQVGQPMALPPLSLTTETLNFLKSSSWSLLSSSHLL